MRGFFRFVLLALVLVMVALMSALTAMRVAIHGREVVVPKLVGLTPAQAERLALDNGLLVELENRFYSMDVAEGRVMSQIPLPGEKVRRGWRVRLAESLGPQHVTIPDIVGQSSRAAEINLRRRGLEPGTVAYARLPNQPQDQVIAQSPPPAAVGVASPKVNLLLAAPPEAPAFVMPNFVGRPL
ncbi:MAG: PASTA domain-containing protein, partial [Terriglobales bacterium]